MSEETKKPLATVLLDALEKTGDGLAVPDFSRHTLWYLLMRADLTENEKESLLELAHKTLKNFPTQYNDFSDVKPGEFKELQAIAFYFSRFAPEKKEPTT